MHEPRAVRLTSAGVDPAPGGPAPASLAELIERPDRIDDGALFWADERALPEDERNGRLILGWHRDGGALVVAVSPRTVTGEELVAALAAARTVTAWSPERWDRALIAFWRGVDLELRARAADRWDLPLAGAWRAGVLTEAAWGLPPAAGPTRLGVLASEVPARVRRAVEWLAAERHEAAAWEIPAGVGPHPRSALLVAGGWSGSVARPLPAEEEGPLAVPEGDGGVPGAGPSGEILATLERLARELGGGAARRGDAWVRFEGDRGEIRAFPGPGGVDLQLVGANEGSLAGLRFRYGVSIPLKPPPDAPPGAHLRLSSVVELDDRMRSLLGAWLAGFDD